LAYSPNTLDAEFFLPELNQYFLNCILDRVKIVNNISRLYPFHVFRSCVILFYLELQAGKSELLLLLVFCKNWREKMSKILKQGRIRYEQVCFALLFLLIHHQRFLDLVFGSVFPACGRLSGVRNTWLE
jgi:hypothetical protein